jgi:hypothetical protein
MSHVTLNQEEAEQASNFLSAYSAYLDNHGYKHDPDWKTKIDQAEKLIDILEGRRPCAECGYYPCCCEET